jgi:hypothetical protein
MSSSSRAKQARQNKRSGAKFEGEIRTALNELG